MASREVSRSRENSNSSHRIQLTPPPNEVGEGSRKLFLLQVFLQNGKNLAVKDASGSSDPYVKFFYGNKLIYRSHTVYKNVNPQWDEKFVCVIDDTLTPLRVEVWDYDRSSNDDFMGCTKLDLLKLDSK